MDGHAFMRGLVGHRDDVDALLVAAEKVFGALPIDVDIQQLPPAPKRRALPPARKAPSPKPKAAALRTKTPEVEDRPIGGRQDAVLSALQKAGSVGRTPRELAIVVLSDERDLTDDQRLSAVNGALYALRDKGKVSRADDGRWRAKGA